jgi:hypothetical protein
VAGLARRVHDSPTLKEKFDKLVEADEELKGNQRSLSHQVPTCWNSDLDCILDHLHFQNVIEQLTANRGNSLQAYQLSNEQWKTAEDIVEILLVSRILSLLS